jgi:hypothetical protein
MQIKRLITILLALSLVLLPVRKTEALLPQIFVALVVVGIGCFICITLKKLAEAIPPLENPPAPPRIPTNAPPNLTSFPASGAYLDDGGVACFNISGTQFDNKDPYGNPYTKMFSTTLQSSTGTGDWTTECSIVGWVSAKYVITVVSTNGVPVITNGCDFTGLTATNGFSFPLSQGPVKLFRSTAWQ